MRFLPSIFALLVLGATTAASAQDYQGSTYRDVWEAARQSPYEVLPEAKVTLGSFYRFLTDKLQQASERTLSNHNDVLPYFNKLLHPNGICLSGTWNITEATPYTGYFKQKSKGLIIVRASAVLSEIHRGEKRAFGIAAKIFPTQNPDQVEPTKTANFFVIDNLGGTYTPHFLDTELTNDITNIDFKAANIGQTGILAAAVKAFGFADRASGRILTVRQLYEISNLGEKPSAKIVTPQYIKLQGQPGPRSEYSDFRDDLRMDSNAGMIRFDISVAADGALGKEKSWTKIGYIELTEDALAEGCDHVVHFHHPEWKSDINSH